MKIHEKILFKNTQYKHEKLMKFVDTVQENTYTTEKFPNTRCTNI